MFTSRNNSNESHSLAQAKTVLMIASSSCSVIGACVIIASFLIVRSVRTASRCIVVVMAIADIMVALPGLIGEVVVVADPNLQYLGSDTPGCKVQSLFTSIGAQVSIIWTAGLAQHMFILVACRKEAVKGGFIVLIAMTGAVIAENAYLYYANILGGAQILGLKWCWIRIDGEGCRNSNCNWMLWNGKVLEITMYAAVFIYYFLLYTKVKHLKSRNDLASSSLVTVISKTGKIVAIPFVFVLVRLWGTLVSLWLIKNCCNRPGSSLFDAFLLMMSFFDMSQGWVNFILYFLTTRQEFNLADRLKLVLRSVPYMTKTRRPHCSENSYLTYNESGGGRRSRSSLTVGNTVSSSRGGGSRTYSSSPKVGHCLQRHGDVHEIGLEL